MKVAIVGAGIVGLSTAWALVRSGHDVTVFEQGPIPNPRSASFDQHRMIRPHYGGQTGYTRMVGEAHDVWERLWDDLDADHFAETGVLAIDYGDSAWMAATHRALEETDTPFERVDWRGIESHAPALLTESATWGLYTAKAGVLFADRIVTDLAAWLSRNGANLRAKCPVAAVDVATGQLTLEAGEIFSADEIVVSAGAWTARLLPALSDRVTPVRSIVGYVAPPASLETSWTQGPALFLMTPAAHLYCLPPVRGSELKFGGAPLLRAGNPDRNIAVEAAECEKIGDAFAPYLRDSNAHHVIKGAGAYYADPDDKRFIIERTGRTIVVTGCGGRMFKFGALVGQRVGDCLDGKLSAGDLSVWARAAV